MDQLTVPGGWSPTQTALADSTPLGTTLPPLTVLLVDTSSDISKPTGNQMPDVKVNSMILMAHQ